MIGFSYHSRMHRRLDRLFTHGLPPRRHAELRRHLRDCDDCRSRYEQLCRVEDALYAEPGTLNPAAVDRLAALVTEPEAAEARPPLWSRVAIPAMSFATVAVLLFAFVPDQDRLASKGVGAVSEAGVAVFRVDDDAGQVERLARGDVVERGDLLQIAYTNRTFSYGVVVGLDAELQLQWYHPSDSGSTRVGVALAPGVADEPFGGAWRIEAPAGSLRLFAVFTNAPVDPEAVETAVDVLRSDGRRIGGVERLPGLGASQDSFLLRVRP